MAELHVTDSSFDEEVLKSDVPVLVDFWAPWCGPCQQIGPIIAEVAEEMEGKAKVCKVNVDENQATAQKYGIMSIPTMMIFKGGEVVDSFVGLRPKEDIIERLTKAGEDQDDMPMAA